MAKKNCENALKDSILNDEDCENCVPTIEKIDNKSDASKKLFSSLSHADLDKIIRGDGNSSSCKKKISQIGCSRNWSPPKKANVKESNSNSFDVVKCLIDGLSDHDYAVPQGKMHDSNSREKNVPNTTKPTSEIKNKQEMKEKSLNENENDIVGQIIQNMDQMKPDVISHLITAASQDGSNNVDNAYQSSKKPKKSVFFKASHKYTYKNYKLSNNIVIQKANNSLDEKKVDSLKELQNNNHHHQTTFNTLPPRNDASAVYKPKKHCCFVCGSRWTLSAKNRFCLKCKRSGEEFPLLKQAQKQMFFLNSRSNSAPKQRAHLAALEKFTKENPQSVGASHQRRCPYIPPKSKYHKFMCDFREKGSAYDEGRNLNFGCIKSNAPTSKVAGKIMPLNHTKGIHLKSKENKSSNINLNHVRGKFGRRSKKQCQSITNVSSSRVMGKQLVFNKHCLKKLSKIEVHSTDGGEIKQNQNSGIPKLKNKSEEILPSDSDNIDGDTDNSFAPVKNCCSSNVTFFEHKLCRESSTTERNVNMRTACNKKSKKKISVDVGDNAPEAAGNTDFGHVKRRCENSKHIKKSKKMVLVDSGDHVHKAADDIVQIKSVKKNNVSSCQKLLKASDDDMEIEERCYTLKHKKKYKHLPSNSQVSFHKQTDSYYQASLKSKNKNISYADKEAEHKSCRETVIKPASKRKPLSAAHTWHVLKQSKKRKKVKVLASDSDDSDMQQDKNPKRLKMLPSHSADCSIVTSNSNDFKVLASDSNDHKVSVSDSNDHKVSVSDSDDSLDIVSQKKIHKNILVDSGSANESPELSGSINIVTYVVDKDSNVKVMPDLLLHEKQKSDSAEENCDQCFSATSKELVDCTSSPECCDQLDESPFTDDTTSNKDYKHHGTEETISKADEVTFHRSSQIFCFNVDRSNDSHKSALSTLEENLDYHEAQTETTLTSYVSNETDEKVGKLPTHININNSDSDQKQLVLENEPKVDPVEDSVTSRFHKDKTSEIEIIDLSPCPSPLQELVTHDKQMSNTVKPCVCTDKTIENSLSSYSRHSGEPISGNQYKTDISNECMQSSSCSGKSNANDSSSLECHRKRVILTNIDETVPPYPGDTVYIKSEKIEIENIVPSKSETAFINTDTEDFQDNFCYRKLGDGLYLMGLPGEMDGKNTSQVDGKNESQVDEKNKVPSNPIPDRKDTDEFIASSTEVKHNCSRTLGEEKEYKFSYRSVGEGITLMYLSDKESEGEGELPVEEHLISKLMESTGNQGHNEEIIYLSDDSCIQLSDDDDDETQNNNTSVKTHGNVNKFHTLGTSVKLEPPKDVEKLEVNSVVGGNSGSSHENRDDTSQNESPFVCNDPVLQISSVFSIPDWDGELENHEGLNDSPVKNVQAVNSEIAMLGESSTLAQMSPSSKGHYNESDSCHRINKFENDRVAEKTKLQVQGEARKVDVLLKEIQDSVKEGQCFFNAVSELDSVTSASIIDLELRSTNNSSAIGIAKNQVYEELQQLLNSAEQVSSEKLQAKINTLRALELLCQKESQELTTDAQKNFSRLSCDGSSNGLSCELETTDSIKTQPLGDEPVILDSCEINEEQESEVVILSPETSNIGVTNQSEPNKESMLSMLLTRPLDSDKSTYASNFSGCDNQNEPPVYGLHMQSMHNIPPCELQNTSNFIDLSINSSPVLAPQYTTNTCVAQTDDASPHTNIMLTNSVPTTLFRDKTMQPVPAYPVQQCNVSRPLNYKSSVAAVSPSVGSNEGFISQVQGLDESDITFCVMCPNIATAVCKSCTKVAYCGEVCAIKYWNEVHHKVCMKL